MRPQAPDMPTIKGDIRFENVSFHYVPGIDVLKDINLHIQAGENVALVGATGAGKSTMATLLHRFADVTQGRITIDGIDIREVQRHSLVRQMSMVLQEPYLFSGTIRKTSATPIQTPATKTSWPRPKPLAPTISSWPWRRATTRLWPNAG